MEAQEQQRRLPFFIPCEARRQKALAAPEAVQSQWAQSRPHEGQSAATALCRLDSSLWMLSLSTQLPRHEHNACGSWQHGVGVGASPHLDPAEHDMNSYV